MKPRLLLIGGWAHDAADLDPLVAELSKRFQVRSHPAADVLRDPNCLQWQVEDASPCLLVGWSLGGMLAMESLQANPETFSALVLISSTTRFFAVSDGKHGVPPANIRVMMMGLRRQPARTLQRFYQQSAAPWRADEVVIRERARRIADGDSEILIDGLRYLSQTDLDVPCPMPVATLVLHGADDQVISPAAASEMADRFARSELKVFADVGHDLPLRNPRWISQAILDFWTRHAGGALHERSR